MIGLYAMIAKKNLVKKIVGMNIFQTAIILFYVSIGAKKGATIPIIQHGHGEGAHQVQITALDPRPINNQLELFAENLFVDNLSANNIGKRDETNQNKIANQRTSKTIFPGR